MKDNEKRNKKGSESTIGKIIYGFLLFMPLFAIGVTCGYAMFNKNAYQSFDGSIEYQETVNVSKPSDLISGRTYSITIINNVASQTNNASYRIGFSQFTLKDYLIDNGMNTISNATFFTIGGAVGYTNNSCFAWYDSNLNYLDRTQLPLNSNIVNNLQFQFTELNTSDTAYFNDTFKDLINVYNNVLVYENTLSNVFYYSVDKVTESPLFSWAENSIIYTTTNATCDALSITTPFIPLLLSYWLIISVMYFLYDIALMLIWVLHDRIHALKDSIT